MAIEKQAVNFIDDMVKPYVPEIVGGGLTALGSMALNRYLLGNKDWGSTLLSGGLGGALGAGLGHAVKTTALNDIENRKKTAEIADKVTPGSKFFDTVDDLQSADRSTLTHVLADTGMGIATYRLSKTPVEWLSESSKIKPLLEQKELPITQADYNKRVSDLNDVINAGKKAQIDADAAYTAYSKAKKAYHDAQKLTYWQIKNKGIDMNDLQRKMNAAGIAAADAKIKSAAAVSEASKAFKAKKNLTFGTPGQIRNTKWANRFKRGAPRIFRAGLGLLSAIITDKIISHIENETSGIIDKDIIKGVITDALADTVNRGGTVEQQAEYLQKELSNKDLNIPLTDLKAILE